MRFRCSIVLLAFVLCGCATQQTHTAFTARDPELDSYFERYCDYTGGMGIGFVASHTYDFKFRQRLKMTPDPELRRLFVLQHLYREIDLAISDFERGIVMTGKSSSRQMSAEDRVATRLSITKRLGDLSRFDPGDPQREIAEFRERLSRAAEGGFRLRRLRDPAAPTSRPPSQLPASSEVQTPNSLRTPSSGGCGFVRHIPGLQREDGRRQANGDRRMKSRRRRVGFVCPHSSVIPAGQ